MKYLLGFILIIITFFSIQNVNADLSNTGTGDFYTKIEKSISPESDSSKITKLQSLLSELKLYSGSIDGQYSSIKDVLVNYQVNSGIIESTGSEDAGYFGKKTIASLKKDFIDFEEKALKTLKLDEVIPPTVGPKTFVVTAYYSPLPNQVKYLKGNYEDEIKLNGKGIKGASGKPVFSGMLAGPKNYPFGTKVYIEGLGIGSVEDRGSAIVSSGNRGYENDRIDVWMGYGDEGLQKALDWGKKTVKGEILENTVQVTMKFNENKLAVLSEENKKKIEEIKQKILSYVDKKYSGNEKLKIKYKSNLKLTLNSYIEKVQSKEKKYQLIYLKEIL